MLEVVRIAIVLLAACGRIGFTGGVDSETIDASPGADGGVIDGRPLDDAGQGDPQGRFVWTTVKFAGELAPRSRTDESDGVRGETWIQGTQLVHRSASLQSGAPIDLATTTHQLVISGSTWRMTAPTSAITMNATWADADHVTLVWDSTAPGTVGTSPIERVTLERAAIPGLVAGVKTMVTAQYANGDVTAGICSTWTGGGRIVTGALTMSPQLVVDIQFTFLDYVASDCSGFPTIRESMGRGFLELEQTAYRLDVDLDTVRMTTSGTLTIDSLMHVVLGACAPAGAACDELPQRLDLTN